MTVQRTRDAVERYLNSAHSDLSMMAEDVVFTTMATGDEHRGVEEVRRMLDHVYHQAFDAKAETRNRIYAEDHAVLEGYFVGKHIGTFAGVEATGRQVRVPLCVVYDLQDAKIVRGRVYLEVPVLMQQLRASPA
jgi:predicted ester cyclase